MSNPLLHRSTLAFQLPDFAQITDEHVREALEVGMAEQIAELNAIATTAEAPTVANTLEAWERSGQTLSRALNAFWVAKAADTSPERDAIMADFSPALAQHSDAVLLNTDLFDRLTLLDSRLQRGDVALNEQESHLLNERLRAFTRAGIALPSIQKDRLRQINCELAQLSTVFEQRLVAGRGAGAVLATDLEQMKGLCTEDVESARRLASEAGRDGWLITLINTTGQPVCSSLSNRDFRQRVYNASVSRGIGGESDTRQLVLDITALRAERANLLGFEHHGAYVADDGCAKNTQNVTRILTRMAPGVLELTHREADDLRDRFKADCPEGTFEAWDWDFYAAQAAAEYAVDGEALKPYGSAARIGDNRSV